MRKLAAAVGPEAQWVVLTAVRPAEVGHHGAIGSEAGSQDEYEIAGLHSAGGNLNLRLVLERDHDIRESSAETCSFLNNG